MKYQYEYPRPAVTVDIVLFQAQKQQTPRVLLIQRGRDPFKGFWALPGGFVEEGEDLLPAAKRELKEETALEFSTVPQQLSTYGTPGRDPRGWTMSVVFIGKFTGDPAAATAGDDAALVSWFPFDKLPTLAFDHAEILRDAAFFCSNFDCP